MTAIRINGGVVRVVGVGLQGPSGPPGPTGGAVSTDIPQPLGVASPGTSALSSAGDHVHPMPTAANVGADPAGTAAVVVSAHEADPDPHPQYTPPVTSVSGRTGAVVVAPSDLAQEGAATAQALVWSGTAWVPGTIATTPAGSGTELQYRNGSAFGAIAGTSWDGATLQMQATTVGNVPLRIKQLAGQTAPMFQVLDSVGNMIARIRTDGIIDSVSGIIAREFSLDSSTIIPAQNSGNPGITLRGINKPVEESRNLNLDGGQAINFAGRGGKVRLVGGRGAKKDGDPLFVGSPGGDAEVLGGDANGTGDNNGGDVVIDGGNATGSGSRGRIFVRNLPTSDPNVADQLWNNAGTLAISAG